MLLELLTDLGTDGGYGEIEGVHCLDFGGLFYRTLVSKSVIDQMVRYSQDYVGMLDGWARTNRSEPFSVGLANSSVGVCPVDCYHRPKIVSMANSIDKRTTLPEERTVVASLPETRIAV